MISIPTFIIPILLTIAIFVYIKMTDDSTYGYLDLSELRYVFGLIPTLIVWLIYFIIF